MFSTDYPHWDFDDPQHAFKFKMTDAQKRDGVPGQRQGVVRPASERVTSSPRADEIAPGQCKLVTVKGREIGVFNVNGEFFALANRCPHAGGPLCEGKIVALVQSDGPGHYRLARHRRVPALPVARLGVRDPHRPVVVRSEDAGRRQFEVTVEPGETAGEGAVRRRDVSRCRSRKIIWSSSYDGLLRKWRLRVVRRTSAAAAKAVDADICVVGAGIAGISAALEAARLGRKVVLIDGLPALGGQAVNSIIGTFCGLFSNGDAGYQFTHGIADDILHDLGASGALHYRRGPMTTVVMYDEVALSRWIEEAVRKAGITVVLGAVLPWCRDRWAPHSPSRLRDAIWRRVHFRRRVRRRLG